MTPRIPRFAWILVLAAALAGVAGAWWTLNRTPETHPSALEIGADLCIVAPATAFDPAWSIAIDAPRAIPDEARCPVCGMYPARFPRWAGQVIFHDGATHFFDSPLNLLTFLADVERYSTYQVDAIIAAYVNDVASNTWTAAATAFYVHGSDALGPMRAGNLPPFSSHESAAAFAAERGGTVLTYDQITSGLLATLSSPDAAHHSHADHHH